MVQAVCLDTRDPAVSLNFAVFLSNQRDVVGAARQLKDFESRVVKLRQTPGGPLPQRFSAFALRKPDENLTRAHMTHMWKIRKQYFLFFLKKFLQNSR